MQRDVFISYSHLRDLPLAEAVEAGLRTIGRPWTGRAALNVFRDTRSLAAGTDLPGAIRKELQRSTYFLYVASPEAAASRWVGEELRFWRDHPDAGARARFLIALSDGEIHWDDAAGDFDWARTTAIPQDLRGVFRTEPLWVDLRPFRDGGDRSLEPGTVFRDKVVALGAAVRGCTKDELDSEDRRTERKINRLKNGAIAGLTALALIAGGASVVAVLQRNEALDRARTSASQALAARAMQIADTDPRKAAQYALHAHQVKQTGESAQALARAVSANANAARHFQGGSGAAADFTGSGGGTPTRVAISRDGGMFAYYTGFDSEDPKNESPHIHLYDIAAGRQLPVLRGEGFPQGGGVFELSADGGLLVVERAFNEIELWDVPGQRLLRRVVASKGEDLSTAHRHLRSFALSRDGKRMAASFYEPAGDDIPTLRMAVWDTASGTELGETDPGVTDVTLAFDDSGGLRAEVPETGRYRTFDFSTRAWSAPRKGPGAGPSGQGGSPAPSLLTAATPDNAQAVMGAEGETVAVYDAAGRRKQRTLGSFTFGVQTISASGDGTWVAAGSNDGAVSLFRGTDPAVRTLRNDDGIKPDEVSVDGRIGFREGGDGGTDVWLLTDPKNGPRKAGNPIREARALTAAGDGRHIVTADSVGALNVWDGRTGKNLKGPYLFGGEGTGTIHAVGDDRHVVGVWKQGVKVVDLSTMTVSQVLTETGGVADLTTDTDGRALVATSYDGTATVWSWTGEGLRKVREAEVTDRRILDTSVSGDGSKVAFVDSDHRVSVLDVAGGRVVTASAVAKGAGSHAEFSADSRLVVQTGDSGTESRLHFWDAATADTLGSWPLGASGFTRIFPASDGGLLTLGADGTLAHRTLSLADWRRTLCTLVPDPLPEAERARYLSDLDVGTPCRG